MTKRASEDYIGYKVHEVKTTEFKLQLLLRTERSPFSFDIIISNPKEDQVKSRRKSSGGYEPFIFDLLHVFRFKHDFNKAKRIFEAMAELLGVTVSLQ